MKLLSNIISIVSFLFIMVIIFRSPIAYNQLMLLLGIESTPVELAEKAYGLMNDRSDTDGYVINNTDNHVAIRCAKLKENECVVVLLTYVANFNYVAALNRLPPPKEVRLNATELTVYITY